jgi:hypothetical protein
MRFERGRDPKETMGIGLIPRIIGMLEDENKRSELKSGLIRDLVILKIEKTLNINLKEITPDGSKSWMIDLKIKGFEDIVHYEFDTPF